MDNGRAYTAEQLAERANVSLRTVRYYVQEGLVDAPQSRGPGAHFTNTHLSQLLRIRLLQDAGLDLKAIREIGPDFENSFASIMTKSPGLGAAIWKLAKAKSAALARQGAKDEGEEMEDAKVNARTGIRIPMTDGVELLVDPDRRMASPKDLVEIALQIRKAFGRR